MLFRKISVSSLEAPLFGAIGNCIREILSSELIVSKTSSFLEIRSDLSENALPFSLEASPEDKESLEDAPDFTAKV